MSEHFANIFGYSMVLFMAGVIVDEYITNPTVKCWATAVGVLCAGALCAAIVRGI